MSAIKQAQANSFFEFGAFFLLELPQGSSFGIDTQEFQVRHFDVCLPILAKSASLLTKGFHRASSYYLPDSIFSPQLR